MGEFHGKSFTSRAGHERRGRTFCPNFLLKPMSQTHFSGPPRLENKSLTRGSFKRISLPNNRNLWPLMRKYPHFLFTPGSE